MYVYAKESNLNSNSKTLEPDQPQHDRPITCVVTQQYSSLTYVSLTFHSRKEKLGARLECFSFFIYFF
jgi:hypothetical protein